jgi:hypothetical protein
MPVIAWVGFAALIVFFGFRLLREARMGIASYGPFQYPRVTSPASFWMFVTIDLVCFLFCVAFVLLIMKAQLL